MVNCQLSPELFQVQFFESGFPARALASWNQTIRAGGEPWAAKRRFCVGNSICQPCGVVCAIAKGNGVLVNCTNNDPSAFVATERSPAISAALCGGCQTACPSRVVQPGSERSTFGNGGAEMHAVRLASVAKHKTNKTILVQRKKVIFKPALAGGSEKNLNIITDLFSKNSGPGWECRETRRQKQWRKKPVYFFCGTRYFERSFVAHCALPI